MLLWHLQSNAYIAIYIRMYYRSGSGVRCCRGIRQTLRVNSSGGRTFLREMTPLPPSWQRDVKKKVRLHPSVFTWRTIVPNFIPIGFETTKPLAFWRGRPNNNKNNKMSSDMRSAASVYCFMWLFNLFYTSWIFSKHKTEFSSNWLYSLTISSSKQWRQQIIK